MATTRDTHERDAIITETFIAAPPERVFKALIDREQALRWGTNSRSVLTQWEMDPRPGGKWMCLARERVHAGDRLHHGEILEIDPPCLLEYT